MRYLINLAFMLVVMMVLIRVAVRIPDHTPVCDAEAEVPTLTHDTYEDITERN